MKKDVFLVVSDLHDTEKNMATRIDYKKEINFVYSRIFQVIKKYEQTDAKVHLLFLGDIFHRSYRSAERSMESMDTVQFLCERVETAHSVVGNHEITWAASNPFWYLVPSLEEAPSILGGKKKLEAKGLSGKLQVVDRLRFGDVEFLFNHYGVRPQQPSQDVTSIGLFHQDVVMRDLLPEMEKKFGVTMFNHGFEFVDDTDSLAGYQYAFVGHQHLSYGTYRYENEKSKSQTEVCWLASLGRTNETEVQDTFLERNLPAILFLDGKFIGVEDNKFDLPSRAECINEAVVLKNKEYRKTIQERKNLALLQFTYDPLENLMRNFDGNPVLQDVIQSRSEGNQSQLDEFIKECFDEVVRK